ncbi:MAG: hypothetical protein KJ950_13100 [Proteobacteria bacterium]|nr:hypothetical protein [Pseudomonadota bacterium]MBU1688415.1 hypothetical protein [Pseudomonadota bacterium]
MRSANKKMITTGILALGLVAAIPAAVMAEDKPEADLTIGALSKYVWRGYELSKDSVVLQPSMSVSYKGVGVNLWGNLDTDSAAAGDTSKWNETDMTVSYDGSAGIIGYGAGWIYYALDGVEDSQEFYASISVDTLLSPTLTVYYDCANYTGVYVSAAIGHSFGITKDLSLDLGAALGYMDDLDNYSALHDGQLSASMTFPLTEMISITPEVHYSMPLSTDAEDAIQAASFDGSSDSFVYGGISTSFSF